MIFFQFVLVISFSNDIFFKNEVFFIDYINQLINFSMNSSRNFTIHQCDTAEGSYLSSNEVIIQEIEPDFSTETTSDNSSSGSDMATTARDKFFEYLRHEENKNRWSAKYLLCKKNKRVIDMIGVTSNFTRHARTYHKEQYEQWLIECKRIKSIPVHNKITNHFRKKSQSSVRQTYGSNHPRQMELSMAIVNDLIISLGLPVSIVERGAFVNFMRKVDVKFTMMSRRTMTRTTLPSLYEKMNDHLRNFCSTATFLSLALDVWSDRRMRSF